MAVIIKPLLNRNLFESTAHRMNSLFQPIQKTKHKESDVVAFIATPILDYVILDAAFALDASIGLINATASLLKALYIWTLNQQQSEDLIDEMTKSELDDFVEHIEHVINAFVAQTLNLIYSALSLVTRPIASIVEAIDEAEEDDELSYGSYQY